MLSNLQDSIKSFVTELYMLSVHDKIPDAEIVVSDEVPFEIPDDIEAEPMFPTIEDARVAFVAKVWDQMETYYRRQPLQDMDMLYGCAMVNISGYYLWWVPLEHPIAELLKNHNDESGEYAPEEIYRTDFGNFAIFTDLAVKQCVKSITTMCTESGRPLQVLITDTELEYLEKQMQEEDEDGEDGESDFEDNYDEGEPALEIIVDEEKKLI
jgi:hypothetical protein